MVKMEDRVSFVLLYRESCRKCRILSRLLVTLSFGTIQRLAHDSPQALSLLNNSSPVPIKVAAVRRGQIHIGIGQVSTALILSVFDNCKALVSKDYHSSH